MFSLYSQFGWRSRSYSPEGIHIRLMAKMAQHAKNVQVRFKSLLIILLG